MGHRDRPAGVRGVEDVRFAERLEEGLTGLGMLLEWPGFRPGPPAIGGELELFLGAGAAHPLPENKAVLATVDADEGGNTINALDRVAEPVLLEQRVLHSRRTLLLPS